MFPLSLTTYTVDRAVLSGRMSDSPSSGAYTLLLKNFDYTGGLGALMDQGEAVTTADYNGVNNSIGKTIADNPVYYWRDFDNNGSITATDLNMILQHNGHKCTVPLNP